MIKVLAMTCFWIGAVYLFLRPSLKRTNRLTRWMSVMLLLLSGVLWVYLRLTIHISRPADWLEQALAPFVPVP